MKTVTRYIPEGYKQFTPAVGDYPVDMFACYVNIEQPKRPLAMFFIGKQQRPAWAYRFHTIEDMQKHITTQISAMMKYHEEKIARREKMDQMKAAEIAAVKVGDLFEYSWGYEQTNVDFYQVVEKKAKSFVVKEIGGQMVAGAECGPMSGMIRAGRSSFIKDAKPIKKTGFSMPHGILSKTTEAEKHYVSWYA